MLYALKRQILNRPNASLFIAGLCLVFATIIEWELIRSAIWNNFYHEHKPTPLDNAIVWCSDTLGESIIWMVVKISLMVGVAMLFLAPLKLLRSRR